VVYAGAHPHVAVAHERGPVALPPLRDHLDARRVQRRHAAQRAQTRHAIARVVGLERCVP